MTHIDISALPALTGSAKQVAWAEQIRAKLVSRINAGFTREEARKTGFWQPEWKASVRSTLTKRLTSGYTPTCMILGDDSMFYDEMRLVGFSEFDFVWFSEKFAHPIYKANVARLDGVIKFDKLIDCPTNRTFVDILRGAVMRCSSSEAYLESRDACFMSVALALHENIF